MRSFLGKLSLEQTQTLNIQDKVPQQLEILELSNPDIQQLMTNQNCSATFTSQETQGIIKVKIPQLDRFYINNILSLITFQEWSIGYN